MLKKGNPGDDKLKEAVRAANQKDDTNVWLTILSTGNAAFIETAKTCLESVVIEDNKILFDRRCSEQKVSITSKSTTKVKGKLYKY